MLDYSAVVALRGLAMAYEEATEPDAWPAAAERELVLLGDVARVLGADEHQVEQVLGSTAAAYVAAAAEAPL